MLVQHAGATLCLTCLVMHRSPEQQNRNCFTMQVQDATASQVPHLLVIPCLLLTLMLGPAGLLSYLSPKNAHWSHQTQRQDCQA